MQPVIEIIQKRRTCRQFSPRQVDRTVLLQLIEAAQYAPSAYNDQNWHFTVVQQPSLLAELKTLYRESMLTYGDDFSIKRASEPDFIPFFGAPSLVFISGEESSKSKFIEITCGAAAQNLLLAAEAFGLGTCLMTGPALMFLNPRRAELERRLGFPPGYRFTCVVALGYIEGTLLPATPRREGVLHFIE